MLQNKKDALMQQIKSQEQLEEEQNRECEAAMELIYEANNKLLAAVKNNNMQSAKVVQVMLTTGNDKLFSSWSMARLRPDALPDTDTSDWLVWETNSSSFS